jgi:tRNA(Ile)-lysidine synthase
MKWSPLAEKVHHYIIRHSLADTGDTIALALSGGLDSVALLHVILELRSKWRWNIVIVHIDHGLRPESDPKESDFCRELAARYGLPYFEKKLELSIPEKKEQYLAATKNHPGTESLARIARYKAFDAWAEELHCNAIFTAHHANDQAETVLYRVLTGSGIKGLAGIPESRGIYRRPLKEILRAELETYVHTNDLVFCEDLSNQNENYVRNRIRHTLLPALKTMGFDQVERLLARSARSLDEAGDALQYFTGSLVKEYISFTDDTIMLKMKDLDKLPVYFQKALFKYVYRESLLVQRHITEKQLEQILDFVLRSETGQSMEIMDTRINKEREHVVWSISESESHTLEISCTEGEFLTDSKGGLLKINFQDTPVSLRTDDPSTAYFSGSLIGEKLICRPWKAGDRLRLFGNGKLKKVSDVLKDEKITARRKRTQIVVLAGNNILWIPGVKRGNEYIADINEKQVVRIQYINGEK